MGSYTNYTSNYLNQLAYPTGGLDMDPAEILRSMGTMYNNPYLFGAGSAASANLFNSVSPGILSPPPPPVSSPSLLGLNSFGLASRGILGNQPSTSSMYSHSGNYLPSPGSASSLSGSKNPYSSLMLNNQTLSSLYAYNNTYGSTSMAGTSSNGATTTTSSKSMYDQTMLNAYSNYFSNSAAAARPTNTPSPLGQQQQSPSNQGPNAKRNPMLSKELSIPSLMPPRNPNLDSPSLPSIPTSVIKSATNISGTSTTTAPSVSHTPLVNTSSSSDTHRRRPSQAERATTAKNDRMTPVEPHITIKNVQWINKSAVPTASSPDANASKVSGDISAKSQTANNANTSTRGISNMGIVYPDKASDDPTRAGALPPKTNMGIVYPINKKDAPANASGAKVNAAAAQMLKKAQKPYQALNTKHISNATATTNTGSSSPVTTLTPVNKGN